MEFWQEILFQICLSLLFGAIGGAAAISLAARSEIRRRVERAKRFDLLRSVGVEEPTDD
jgi:hypothetical protein